MIDANTRGPLADFDVTFRRRTLGYEQELAVWIGGALVGVLVVAHEHERKLLELVAYNLAGNGAREVP